MNNQPRKSGRPFGTVKPARLDIFVSVRITPAISAYLEAMREHEGFSNSDAVRALMLEAMRARGVFPTT